MTVHLTLLAALPIAGAVIVVCQVAYNHVPSWRIGESDRDVLVARRLCIVANAILVLVLYVAALALFGDRFVRDGRSIWWEPLSVLAWYDLGYYWLHRALHWRPLMRTVHGVHHRTRHPTVWEGLYVHPLDTALAHLLLFGCILIVGPVGLSSLLVVVVGHTVINALGHTNLRLPGRPMALANAWAVRHDAHHAQRNVNFGAITPVWDRLFGTAG